jgi:septal ring factor EnvC (AmiA/AmiB activator)
VATGVAAAALVAVLGSAGALADRDDDLERLRGAIAESRERVAVFEKEQRGLLWAIEALDRSAELLEEDVALAQSRAARARSSLRVIRAEAAEIEEALRRTKRAMRVRAVALYKAGEMGSVRLLFSANGIRDFLSRVSMLRLLLGHDAELLARHRAQSEALASAELRASAAARDFDAAAATLDERSRQLVEEREIKRQMVARIHRSRASERAALVELENAARAMEETFAMLRSAPAQNQAPLAGPPFASQKGSLPGPVDAAVARRFGRVVDAEFRTETFRKGVDFDARHGTPVRAVANGDVRFAGWFRGYGRLVILDHGESHFSVMGHLADVSVTVGERVASGTVIGSVGDTGSLSGPRLYFEIRVGADAEDPAVWLRPRD